MARTSKQVLAAVELLKEKSAHAYRMYKYYRDDGDDVEAEGYIRTSMAYDDVISILTNKKYADRMREIFLTEEPA